MSTKDNLKKLASLNTMTEPELRLNDVSESAKNTLKESLMFFKIVKEHLTYLNVSSREDAYAINNALATNLSISCELSLKSLYLYEQQNSGKSVNELWADLRNPRRINPNLGNKTSGHSLDILLSHLSNEVRTLIDYRIRMLNKDLVEKYPDITFIDILAAKGIVNGTPFMSSSEYDTSLISHRETFVSSRYGGQAYSNPDLVFLYHLAMQLSTIARFLIMPARKVSYNLNVNDYIGKVPNEVISLYQIKPEYVTDDLIKLFVKRGNIKVNVLRYLLTNCREYIDSYSLEPLKFYYMIAVFDVSELSYVFDSVKYLEAEQNNDIVSFLNFCIMTRTIFKEQFEDVENVKFAYIDYLSLAGVKKFKLEKMPESLSVVEYRCGDSYYISEEEDIKKI